MSTYECLADVYDRCMGRGSFRSTRRAFEKLQRRYGITFRSAADLGSGTGLFACYLHDVWRVPVFAVDLSPAMVREARRRCPRPGVRVLCQDIRRLCLPCPVDLITAHFDTLNHITQPSDLKAAFTRIFDHLRPGGHLIFDLVTEQLTRMSPPCVSTHYWIGGSTLTREMTIDPRRRLLGITVIRRWKGVARPRIQGHLERGYSLAEAVTWLRDTGFRLRAVLDALTLRHAARQSMRIAIVARRLGGSATRMPAGP